MIRSAQLDGRKSSAKNVITLLTGTVGAQAISMLAVPAVTRLYKPDDFGVFAVYVVAVTMIVSVASLRYELAIPLAKSRTERRAVTTLALGIVGIVAVATLLVVIAAECISWCAGVQYEVPKIAWVLPIAVLGGGAYQCFTYCAIAAGQYRLIAATRLRQSLAQTFGQLAASVIGGPVGLAVGDCIGRSVGSGSMISALRGDVTPPGVNRRSAVLLAAARRHARFPKLSVPAALLNNAGLYVPLIGMSWGYGAEHAGYLSLNLRLLGLPLAVLGTAVGQAYLGAAASSMHDRSILYRQLFAWSSKIALIGAIPFSIILVGGAPLFGLVFGAEWEVAGRYAQMLVPAFFAQLCVVPFSQTLNLIQRQDLQAVWDAVRLGAVSTAVILVPALGGSAQIAVAAFGTVAFMCYVGLFVLIATVLRGESRVPAMG